MDDDESISDNTSAGERISTFLTPDMWLSRCPKYGASTGFLTVKDTSHRGFVAEAVRQRDLPLVEAGEFVNRHLATEGLLSNGISVHDAAHRTHYPNWTKTCSPGRSTTSGVTLCRVTEETGNTRKSAYVRWLIRNPIFIKAKSVATLPGQFFREIE